MQKSRGRLYVLSMAFLGVIACASNGVAQVDTSDIAVVATDSKFTSSNTNVHTLADFAVANGSSRKLVVTLNTESSSRATNVTYGGVALTKTADAPAVNRVSEIWYLDDPAVGTADIVAEWDGDDTSAMTVLSVQNAASGFDAVSIETGVDSITNDITTTSIDMLVVGCYTENGGGPIGSAFPNDVYTGGSGSSASQVGYAIEAVPGLKEYAWGALQADGGSSFVVSFEGVPGDLPPVLDDIDAVLADTINRQEQVLADQLANPYPAYIPDNASSCMWNKESFAQAAYWLNQQTAAADEGLILISTNGIYEADVANNHFHWNAYLLARIYYLFSSQSDYFPNRMSPAAEEALLEMLWDWASVECKLINTDPLFAYPGGSENHNAQYVASYWSTAQIFANHPVYSTLTYADGTTPAAMASAWNEFAKKTYCDRFLARGMLMEVGSPTYQKYTLNAWLTLADFATDPELKAAASSMLDIYWANWAMEQIDGLRGGSRHRCYAGDASIKGGTLSHSWFFTGVGSASKHPGAMSAATTFWRPSRAVVGLALDTEGRGEYGYVSRRLGYIDQDAVGPHYDDFLDPEGGHLLRYSWCTPDFVMGMSMMDVLPNDQWGAACAQNRRNGVYFGGHETARIYTIPNDSEGDKVYNAEWGVQHKGAMILQHTSKAERSTGQMVWFDASLNRTENSGWIFAEAPRAYAAVKIMSGGWSWDYDPGFTNMGEYAVLNDKYSPIIIETVRKQDYGSMAAFQAEILSNPLSYSNDRLDYTSTGYGTTLTLFTDESARPRIDGVPVDLEPKECYVSPYLNGDFAEGPVIIEYGDDRTIHGVAPFADDAGTLYHWDFETTYPVIHPDSTTSIGTITDGRFGEAFRCSEEAGDQVLMTASPWPASHGNVRYQGWFRLNSGDTGGTLFHVHDQVDLSLEPSSVTLQINRSGNPADTSATNVIELSASISTSNEWQYVEAVYDGDTIKLVTEEETVSAPGIGTFMPNNGNVYVGSLQNSNNYVGDMDEVRVSVRTADPVSVAASADHFESSKTGVNTVSGFTPLTGEHTKLVVAASWESGSGIITNVTYGSQSFAEAVSCMANRNSSIWYLDEPLAGNGDVTVRFDTATASLIGVLSLDNVAPGAPEVTASLPASTVISLTNQTDNSLVIGVYSENGNGVLSSDFTHTLYSGGSGSSVGNAGYQVEALAGAKTYTWTAATNGCAVAAASFAPAPAILPPPADDDADGMADAWELQHFGTLGAADGTDDADHDGFTDAQESIAGTDPLDADSRLVITGLDHELHWQSVQGKRYRILSSTNLVEGSWTVDAEGIPGGFSESAYSVSNTNDTAYLKVEVE